MELCKLGYSKKNSPTPPQPECMKTLQERKRRVNKKKALEGLFLPSQRQLNERAERKTIRTQIMTLPTSHPRTKYFENDLVSLIQRTKLKKTYNRFQQVIKNDTRNIN